MKWISIDTKLPEENQEIICYNGVTSNMAIFRKQNGENSFELVRHTIPGERVYIRYWTDVTHWMPKPDSPDSKNTITNESFDEIIDYVCSLYQGKNGLRRKAIMLRKYLQHQYYKHIDRKGVLPD